MTVNRGPDPKPVYNATASPPGMDHHAREQYASRWIEFNSGAERLPDDFPIPLLRVQNILFNAGSAEWYEAHGNA